MQNVNRILCYANKHFLVNNVLGCPESVFFLKTRLLQQRIVYTNLKSNMSNVVIFSLIGQNGSYVIR